MNAIDFLMLIASAPQATVDVPVSLMHAMAVGGTLTILSLWPFIYNNMVWFKRLDQSYIHLLGGISLGIGLLLLCAHSNLPLGAVLAAVACVADPGTRELFGAPYKGSGRAP
jgi:hypothetical protein